MPTTKAETKQRLIDALCAVLRSEDDTLGDGGSILGDDIREHIQNVLIENGYAKCLTCSCWTLGGKPCEACKGMIAEMETAEAREILKETNHAQD